MSTKSILKKLSMGNPLTTDEALTLIDYVVSQSSICAAPLEIEGIPGIFIAPTEPLKFVFAEHDKHILQ